MNDDGTLAANLERTAATLKSLVKLELSARGAAERFGFKRDKTAWLKEAAQEAHQLRHWGLDDLATELDALRNPPSSEHERVLLSISHQLRDLADALRERTQAESENRKRYKWRWWAGIALVMLALVLSGILHHPNGFLLVVVGGAGCFLTYKGWEEATEAALRDKNKRMSEHLDKLIAARQRTSRQ